MRHIGLIWRYIEFTRRCKFNRGPPFAKHCYYIFILCITFPVNQSTGCFNSILKLPEHAFLCTSYTCENQVLLRFYRHMQITLHNHYVILLLNILKWKYVSYLPLRNEAVLLSESVCRRNAYRLVTDTKQLCRSSLQSSEQWPGPSSSRVCQWQKTKRG